MAVSASAFSQVLRAATEPKPKKQKKNAKAAEAAWHVREAGDLKPTASFKRKYGILKKAAKSKPAADRSDSDYGMPLPPGNKRYAHAVLARAHQASSFDQADVDKQVRKANKIIYGVANPTDKQKTKHRAKESHAALREYLAITPKGSWEGQCELIRQAAASNPAFGGGIDGARWAVSIWASYPAKNVVVIANSETGQLWVAKYAIDAATNSVSFPVIKNAQQSISVQEALKLNAKRLAERGRGKVVDLGARRLRERGTATQLSESFKFQARVREVQLDDDGKGARAICVMLAEGPGNRVDGHYYLGETLDLAAESGVFEGVQSYADHPDELEEQNRPERSIRDLIGWWSDVHVEEAGGKKYLIGTFNIETGNDFALNKMREAKRFQERYKDDTSKQYVAFSIYAGGISESREIDGKTYKAVLRITEAGSTDMVTRAGAGGKMLSLKEEQRMGKTASLSSARERKNLAESLADTLLKQLTKKGAIGATGISEASLNEALDAAFEDDALGDLREAMDGAGLDLDKHVDGIKKAVAKHISAKLKGKGDDENEDPDDEDAMGMGIDEDVTGDSSMDDILGDDDDDDTADDGDPDDDDDDADGKTMEAQRRVAAANGATSVRERELAAKVQQLELREKQRSLRETAAKVVREANVAAGLRKDLVRVLVENCANEKAMRSFVAVMNGGRVAESVVGNGTSSRTRESANSGLLAVSGLVK